MIYFGRQSFKLFKDYISNKSQVLGLVRTLSFKSPYALENLYPKSNLKLFTPKTIATDNNEKFSGFIPLKELEVTYSSSSGPGGQNVNRVKTKVDLRFHVESVTFINDDIKKMLFEKYPNKINNEGYFIIKSDITRSQQLNLADALHKLRHMIRDVIVVPPEPSELTLEIERKRALLATRERVYEKRARSRLLADRRALNSNYD